VTSNPGSGQRIIGLVVGGVGVVGLGVGTIFGLNAISHEKKADKACSPTLCQEQGGQDESDSAHHAAVISNVAFGVGGGLIAVGALVYLLAPTKSEAVGVTPLLAPGFAGLSVGGKL
jgi:serine/threonine-protein kinase